MTQEAGGEGWIQQHAYPVVVMMNMDWIILLSSTS